MVSRFLRYWVPVLLFMALIYGASSDTMSFEHSSRFLGPLLHWLFPNISPSTQDALLFSIRKLAHFTEYAILVLLVWRALRHTRRTAPPPPGWTWRHPLLAFVLVGLYAISDELHQTFVPTRQGSYCDVLIDASGAAVALVLLWAIGRWRKHW